MTIKKFPLASLLKVRKYIRYSLALPEVEQETQYSKPDEMPEPESLDALSGIFTFGGTPLAEHPPATIQEEWFVSTVNPGACLLKLPGLRLKPTYRLVSYLFRSQDRGVGVIWAVPEAFSTMTELEKALPYNGTINQLPRPEKALKNFMEGIDGDRSPSSFLIASLLRRELQEFGALSDRQSWSHHELVDQLPQGAWDWQTAQQPKDLWPKVRILPSGGAAVEFFSFRKSTPHTLYRHLDQYAAESYQSRSLDNSLAVQIG